MKKASPYLVLIVLVVAAIVIRNCTGKNNISSNKEVTIRQRGLNRNPAHINYSKHARCRMDCRKVDEREVVYILKNGKINYNKSDLKGADCNKKYAVEGISQDKQRLRIVFAPCNDEVTVVTCIDLDTDWECNCEGD
ncbi:MAG: DUF4258 domain-containing protein [Chitinophagaceae bacterium]|nr:DUF4258 domain-containing protein [Chitinophagaceae bacterium]MCW5905951.1 DUF4258 domain-containing protein [Chitinophagaceae bacterium]